MTLKEFLKNPSDYESGVAFYNAHFGPGQWERKFTARATQKFLHANLVYDLKKLAASGKIITINAEASPSKVNNIPPQVHSTPPKVHNIVPEQDEQPTVATSQTVYSNDRAGKELEARALYSRLGKRREDLYSPDKEVRKAAAVSIKADAKRNRELRNEINYFDKHGVWPSDESTNLEVDVNGLSFKELLSLKKNLAPWCSKEKGKIEKEQDPLKKSERLKNLEAKQALLTRVNEKIDQM